MNQIHVLLSIHNVLLHESDTCLLSIRHESDTCITVYIYTCFVNVHVLLRHESDTCITVYT